MQETLTAPATIATRQKLEARLFFIVRFKGCVCAAVKTGVSRKPILLRARKAEQPFRVVVPEAADEIRRLSENGIAADQDEISQRCIKVARVECARAIKRTEAARRKLQGNHMLRGVPSVERLLLDYKQTRRGKRWKICSLYSP